MRKTNFRNLQESNRVIENYGNESNTNINNNEKKTRKRTITQVYEQTQVYDSTLESIPINEAQQNKENWFKNFVKLPFSFVFNEQCIMAKYDENADYYWLVYMQVCNNKMIEYTHKAHEIHHRLNISKKRRINSKSIKSESNAQW